MSIEYCTCEECGTGYPDCWEEAIHCSCGVSFCGPACAKEGGFITDDDEDDECKYCRSEDMTDMQLLWAFVNRSGKTRAENVKQFLAEDALREDKEDADAMEQILAALPPDALLDLPPKNQP